MIYVFLLTLLDSLCGCLQVFNLMAHRRFFTFITSIVMSMGKVGSIFLVVKAANLPYFLAYALGGALGAQLSLYFRRKYDR